MGQGTDQSRKHTCIFELERNGDNFTGDVVCRVCGVKLSSDSHTSVNDEGSPEPPRHP